MTLRDLTRGMRRKVVSRLISDDDLFSRYIVYGDRTRLRIHPTARLSNATLNTVGGLIVVGPHAFFGHHVTVLTGRHDYRLFGLARQECGVTDGQDVTVEEGAWVATNSTIIGPCRIGRHAVVGACSLVLEDVPPYAVVFGAPARIVRTLDRGEDSES